jgi:hypothetical protein
MSWRVARSLVCLRDELNAAFPSRSKRSDGSIGDAAHATRTSDHNPWVGPGVVTALDFTHDPSSGASMDELAEVLRASRDPRIKYVIWNRRIFSATTSPWQWRPYSGSNPHTTHLHISVVSTLPGYDDARPWGVSAVSVPQAPVVPPTPAPAPTPAPEPSVAPAPVVVPVVVPVAATPVPVAPAPKPTPAPKVLRQGDQHAEVVTLRAQLNRAFGRSVLPRSDRFDAAMTGRVRAYQLAHGLTVDGAVGPATRRHLATGERIPVVRRGESGPAVARIQGRVGVRGPDRFGPKTETAVRGVQRRAGLTVDGVVGPDTWAALAR